MATETMQAAATEIIGLAFRDWMPNTATETMRLAKAYAREHDVSSDLVFAYICLALTPRQVERFGSDLGRLADAN